MMYIVIKEEQYKVKHFSLIYEYSQENNQLFKVLTLTLADETLKDVITLSDIQELNESLIIYKNNEPYLTFTDYNFSNLDYYETDNESGIVIRFNMIEGDEVIEEEEEE